ncbi:wax synthase family protein [Aspergillus lucknowensis]|uniref:Membrane bound O-acyl transferase family-domain-containing protein n=1 Tax=Aspergillus lucknowensis TaxID=176173 RepID=A0ABR4LD61_9EURO
MAPPGIELAVLSFVLIHLITSSIIAFTSRSSSIRPAALVLIVGLAVSLQNIVAAWDGYRVFAAVFSLFAWMNTFSALDFFLYTRVTNSEHFEWLSRRGPSGLQRTLSSRIRWALGMPFNYRRVGTKWQSKATHPFDPHRPGYIPSRADFVLHRLLVVLVCYLALFFIFVRPGQTSWLEALPQGQRKVILDEYSLSLYALPSRFYLTTSFILGITTAQKAHYNTISAVAVLLHLSNPEDWPPIQGPYQGTWSVRQLWGATWHQNFRQFLSANADFITVSLLRLKPRSLAARYSRFFFSFLLSGIIHIFWDEACGIPRERSGAFIMFTIQPVAFAIEELAQWVSRRFGILREDQALRTLIGYVWVGVFCTLSWPIWFYPSIRESESGGWVDHLIHLPVPAL